LVLQHQLGQCLYRTFFFPRRFREAHRAHSHFKRQIEPAAARRAAGKPASGQVTVAVALRGPKVEVTVSDDGHGLDTGAIRDQLRKRAIAAPTDDLDLAQTILTLHPDSYEWDYESAMKDPAAPVYLPATFSDVGKDDCHHAADRF
jgi:hypothetical protein